MSAAGEKNVVDQDYNAPIDSAGGQDGLADDRTGANDHQIVAVKCDVQRAERKLDTLCTLDLGADEIRNLNAASLDAHDGEITRSFISLDELTSHPHYRSANRLFVHDRDVQYKLPSLARFPMLQSPWADPRWSRPPGFVLPFQGAGR